MIYILAFCQPSSVRKERTLHERNVMFTYKDWSNLKAITGACVIVGLILGFIGPLVAILFFGGEYALDENGRMYVRIGSVDYLILAVMVPIGAIGGSAWALTEWGLYRVKLAWWSRKLDCQGWHTAAAQLREYAKDQERWANGIDLDVPHP